MNNENGNRTWTVKIEGERFFESTNLQKCAYFVNNTVHLRINPDARVSISSFVTGASE